MNQKIRIIASKNSWIEQDAIDQLEGISSLEGIVKVVGLPDLHPGKTPVGAAFISENIIYPHIIGNDIGCGMSLFMTDIKKHKVNISRWIKKLETFENMQEIDIEGFIKEDIPFLEKIGTIGGGNHFAEFQQIEKVFDEAIFETLGINKKNMMILVHSGSRGYGQEILDEVIKKYHAQKGLRVGSNDIDDYLKQHEKAVKWAENNRKWIAYRLLKALGSNTDVQRILDSTHNSITKKHLDEKVYYIHRKGAAPGDLGPVIIPGSRGSLSYIVMPKECEISAYSIAHGAGRKWKRGGCKEKLENKYTKKTIKQTKFGANVVCKNKNLLFEEAPEAYKNIERVIEDLLDANLITVVATLKPVVTYKG
ncbi:RNA ligase RtcB family protein [Marinisporobacter balticus]|uniref:3'-phosphate/5'-hydroxy nucleic acid ligase n=1 Tax=Marinisporobacter balticus TaxID=2018667 RepID=A0A4R2KAX9_9FIRM|nr:RNA ligase RtcB family protein [Marinisporobacter balticus]TCO69352.1 release factor H-coupled RctB family protein [Marinisporobacter balticus]